MKISLKNTPEQVELIKAMGSKNKLVSQEAMEAFSAFISPVARKVLDQAGLTSMIYTKVEYDEDDNPSIPLDLFYNEGADYITVWSQSMAGGLPSSFVTSLEELKISTFRLDSAVSFLKKYARKARLDVISKTVSKMLQEVLVKENLNGFAVLLKALAEASTNGNTHVIAATTASVLQIDDFNRLLTRARRINVSFNGGSPADYSSRGVTDLLMSPEMIEQVRAFAYQPMNTRGVPNSDESTVVALPDSVREGIYRSAGTQEIYGINIHELLELGTSQRYNTIFDTYYTPTFDPTLDEVIIGLDLSRDAFISPIARNADSGSTFSAVPDDQYVTRQDKAGLYGSQELGFVCIDSRGVVGLTV